MGVTGKVRELLAPTCRSHSQESLTQRSSPLPQYCLPLVRRLALTGLSSLGLRMTLKICFPVHRVTGWRRREARASGGPAWSHLPFPPMRQDGTAVTSLLGASGCTPDHRCIHTDTATAPAQTFSIVGGGRRTLIFSSLPTSIEAMI